MSNSLVSLDVDKNGIATVRINNPTKGNAFNDVIIGELISAFNTVQQNSDVRVMILASEGKHFCTGADLNWMRRMIDYDIEQNLTDARLLAKMLYTLNTLPIPTIARVQGACYGGAVGLVSCCDMAVGTANASFCLSEVKVGLIPATIAPYVIIAIGERAARRYFNTAEVMPPQTAEKLGLLSHYCESGKLDNTISTIVNMLLQNSPAAITQSKALIAMVSATPIDEKLIEETSQCIANIRVSKEGQEGLLAFINKQPPNYRVKPS